MVWTTFLNESGWVDGIASLTGLVNPKLYVRWYRRSHTLSGGVQKCSGSCAAGAYEYDHHWIRDLVRLRHRHGILYK